MGKWDNLIRRDRKLSGKNSIVYLTKTRQGETRGSKFCWLRDDRYQSSAFASEVPPMMELINLWWKRWGAKSDFNMSSGRWGANNVHAGQVRADYHSLRVTPSWMASEDKLSQVMKDRRRGAAQTEPGPNYKNKVIEWCGFFKNATHIYLDNQESVFWSLTWSKKKQKKNGAEGPQPPPLQPSSPKGPPRPSQLPITDPEAVPLLNSFSSFPSTGSDGHRQSQANTG